MTNVLRETRLTTAGQRRARPEHGRTRLDVQGIRAVAVLLVIGFHAGLPLPGGFTGVDVFFVVSGFVITGLIMREQASPEGFRFLRFYQRRARRLLPALALMVAAVTVASIALQSPAGSQQIVLRTGIAAALFAANLEIYRSTGGYFDAPAEGNPLLHTWSLSVEEQFYFLFPLILVGLLAWRARRRNPVVAATVPVLLLAALGLVSLLLARYLVGGGHAPGIGLPAQFAFYASPTRAWEFVAGALVALAATGIARLPRWVGVGLGWAGFGLLVAAVALVDGTSGVPGSAAVLPVLATVALIAGGTAHSGPVSRMLSTAPLVRVGDLSYSLYLWHWPVIVTARLLFPQSAYAPAVAALASFLPAWLAYRYVEEPIHHGRRLATWSGARVGVVFVAAAMVVLGAQHTAASLATRQPATQSYIRAITTPHYGFGGCDLSIPLGAARPPVCDVGPVDSTRTVYLLGDSQAGQLTEAVIAAADTLHWRASIATENGCPYAPIPGGCPSVLPSRDWLLTQPPGVVVIATEVDAWIKRTDLLAPEANGALSDRQRIARWVAAMRTVTGPLVEAGHRVLLVQPTPRFHEWEPTHCLGLIAYTDPARCGTTVDRTVAERYRLAGVRAQRILARDPGVGLLDPFDRLCDARRCYTNQGSRWYSRDVDHISVELAEGLGPSFTSAFASAARW